jgi:hypothetical protein
LGKELLMSTAKPPLSETWADTAPAGDTGILDPGGLKSTGWTAATAAPAFSWMNWILNKVDAGMRYMLARGIPDYDANEDYTSGDKSRSVVDGNTYTCILANGHTSAKEPHVNPTYWIRWGHTDADISGMIGVNVADGSGLSGITVTGAVTGTAHDAIFTQTGGATIATRCTFRLTLGSSLTPNVITFSGSKAFPTRITSVQVTQTTYMTVSTFGISAQIISAQVISISGPMSGADYFVTVEGY